jgi:hypothetical protein
MKRFFWALLSITILMAFLFSCAATFYIPEPPPPLKEEIKPPHPGPKAVWVEGHWKWSHGQYVWVPGHWVKNPKGVWVKGHWKKTPRGWKWVKGHWRR